MSVQSAAEALLALLPSPFATATFRLNADVVKAFQEAAADDKGLSSTGNDGVLGPVTMSELADYVTLPPYAPGVVPATNTPASATEIAASIGRGYQRATGQLPSQNALQTLTAQALVETGNGLHMNNHNFGNVHGKSATGASAILPDQDAQHKTYYTPFRAYPTLDDGAADYAHLMLGQFSAAMPAAQQNDLTGFATALKAKGYFEALVSDYVKGLQRYNDSAGAAARAWLAAPGGGQNGNGGGGNGNGEPADDSNDPYAHPENGSYVPSANTLGATEALLGLAFPEVEAAEGLAGGLDAFKAAIGQNPGASGPQQVQKSAGGLFGLVLGGGLAFLAFKAARGAGWLGGGRTA